MRWGCEIADVGECRDKKPAFDRFAYQACLEEASKDLRKYGEYLNLPHGREYQKKSGRPREEPAAIKLLHQQNYFARAFARALRLRRASCIFLT